MDFIKDNSDTILEIMKWVLLVLITGFIAQFGKKFASYIIAKFNKDESSTLKNSAVPLQDKEILDKKQLKEFAKIEKKKAKNLKKSQK